MHNRPALWFLQLAQDQSCYHDPRNEECRLPGFPLGLLGCPRPHEALVPPGWEQSSLAGLHIGGELVFPLSPGSS